MKIEPGQVLPRIKGDVFLPKDGADGFILGELGVQFTEIEGKLYVWSNSLTTLKGFPTVVGLSLTIARSGLGDLSYCPERVGAIYLTDNINLRSLKGFPKHVRSNISVKSCPITSLEYLPKTVYGGLELDEITEPLSFVNGPEIIQGDLTVTNSIIDSMDGFPEEVLGNVAFVHNLRPDYMPYDVSAKEIRNICQVSGSINVGESEGRHVDF